MIALCQKTLHTSVLQCMDTDGECGDWSRMNQLTKLGTELANR